MHRMSKQVVVVTFWIKLVILQVLLRKLALIILIVNVLRGSTVCALLPLLGGGFSRILDIYLCPAR